MHALTSLQECLHDGSGTGRDRQLHIGRQTAVSEEWAEHLDHRCQLIVAPTQDKERVLAVPEFWGTPHHCLYAGLHHHGSAPIQGVTRNLNISSPYLTSVGQPPPTGTPGV